MSLEFLKLLKVRLNDKIHTSNFLSVDIDVLTPGRTTDVHEVKGVQEYRRVLGYLYLWI
jgi:FtsZ-binding cell division protein ZapB